MIPVKVELHSAITGKVTTLGQMLITNDGTGNKRLGNYDVLLSRRGREIRAANATPVRLGRVENHRRLSKPVWNLIAKSLRNLGFLSP